jgi:nitrogen fixation-related uncharacterized protein
MKQQGSPDVQIEYVHHRRRQWKVVGGLVALAVMLGVLALFGFAYAIQSDRVEELEAQNEGILNDHHAIGAKFTKQSRRFAEESKKLEDAIRASYGRGFVAGQAAVRLPASLKSLADYAAAGVLVPRRVPSGGGEPRILRELGGYTIRWRSLALFASRTEPLSDWRRQALGGVRWLRLGSHRVQRLTAPTGVVYAWRKRGATYAVIALPAKEPAARALVASMQ